MIVFPHRYNEPIKTGEITLAFRDWNTLKLQKNKIYKSFNLGLLKILDIRFRKLSDVSAEEIRGCGCRSLIEFKKEYAKLAERQVDFGAEVCTRIEFEYLGSDIENKKKVMGRVTPLELYELKQKILVIEERSEKPWVVRTLRVLVKEGAVVSDDLGENLNIPSQTIKSHMTTLRELNLVSRNCRRGYSGTPLGLKILKILDKKD